MGGRDGGEPLPWGWWLRVKNGAFEDVEGNRWRSVRDAFWRGHLKFPDVRFAPEQHELLVRVLGAIDGGWFTAFERKHDMFGGDMVFWRFHTCWLWSVGLLEARRSGFGGDGPLDAGLSDEGRSVLAMLRATRDPAWVDLPMAQVIEEVRSDGSSDADAGRERALLAFERDAAGLPYVFAREVAGRSHLVTLTGMATDARMPTRRVVWSLSFADSRVRDDFFAWTAERVARWEDWGGLAWSKGAAALTKHLLVLFAARLSGDRA